MAGAVVILSSLGGCGDDADDRADAGAGMEAPTTSVAEEVEMTPSLAPDARQGVAVSRSDVGDQPERPLAAGSVLFFPEDRAGDVAAAAGLGQEEAGSMQHASFALQAGRLGELAGVVAPIGTDGRFPVPAEVASGRHLVCLADSFADHAPGPPFQVVGCALVDVPDRAVLTVAFGEGGVEASLG